MVDSPDDASAAILEVIETAHLNATNGKIDLAVAQFDYARALVTRSAESSKLNRLVNSNFKSLSNEREKFTQLYAKKNDIEAVKLSIIADSLGLPRPDNGGGDGVGGASCTYSALLQAQHGVKNIHSLSQRFYTTDDVVRHLIEDPTIAENSKLVVHVGLNDCANRMFMEPERIGMSLYHKSVSEKMVSFVQKYRNHILGKLPARHYVDLHQFARNLTQIAQIAKARNATKIVFCTIIIPPRRFWAGTKGMSYNFSRYNLEIMRVASEFGIELFDIDRLVWEKSQDELLLSDGMHLSDVGHKYMAEGIAELIR